MSRGPAAAPRNGASTRRHAQRGLRSPGPGRRRMPAWPTPRGPSPPDALCIRRPVRTHADVARPVGRTGGAHHPRTPKVRVVVRAESFTPAPPASIRPLPTDRMRSEGPGWPIAISRARAGPNGTDRCGGAIVRTRLRWTSGSAPFRYVGSPNGPVFRPWRVPPYRVRDPDPCQPVPERVPACSRCRPASSTCRPPVTC